MRSPADNYHKPSPVLSQLSRFLVGAAVLCAVNASAVGTGTLDQVSGWYPLGTNLTVHASPGTNSVFTRWLGNTNGASLAGSQITLAINSSLSVTGLFSAIQIPTNQLVPRISVNGKSLELRAANGVPNGAWVLLQSTNLMLPLSQWPTNRTGSYDGSGNLATNLLNAATNPMGFYLLK